MKLTNATTWAILGATAASASIVSDETTNTTSLHFYEGTCTPETITVRKEWRNLSDAEKTAYFETELCLMSLPAQTDFVGVTSRFTDLQGLHRDKTNQTWNGIFLQDVIHNVGQFLPWHRLFMHTHETMMRTQCNYTGPMAWWDEAKDADAGNMFQSNMWGPDAFGSNGTGDELCVTDGAFANMTEYIGPLVQLPNEEYCYSQSWDETMAEYCTTEAVKSCTQYNDYYSFFNCIVVYPTGVHVSGHQAAGGLMHDINCSAGAPTFYLHHNYIDRLWWQWQQANSSSRMYDISGNTLNETYLEEEGLTAPIGGYANITLDYALNVQDMLPDVKIGEIMNVHGGYLCYEYDY